MDIGRLNYSNLINYNHPLNRRLKLWYLTLPDRRLSSVWRDMSGRLLPGQLTGSGGAPWWDEIPGRIGAWGSLNFQSANSEFVETNYSQAEIPSNGSFSAGCWVRPGLVDSTYRVLLQNWDSVGWLLWINNTDVYRFQIDNIPYLGTVAPVVGRWDRVDVDFDGVTMRIYVNGMLDTANAVGSGVTPGASGDTLTIGHAALGGGSPYEGRLDDVTLWYRSRSANEIYQRYLLSRRYYHGLINRVSRLWRGYTFQEEGGPPPGQAGVFEGLHAIESGV